jgi:hypothetical protein
LVQEEQGPLGSVPTLTSKILRFRLEQTITFDLVLSVMLLKITHSNSSLG